MTSITGTNSFSNFSFPAQTSDTTNTYAASTTAATTERRERIITRTERWAQLSIIITGIALVAILSATAVLPSYFLVATGAVVIHIIFSSILHRFLPSSENRQYMEKTLNHWPPIALCIAAPLVEELIFRAGLQRGMVWFFKFLLPSTPLSLLGISMPLSAAVAIAVSGTIFGLAHVSNHYEHPALPLLSVTTAGIFVEGLLYHFYGLPASIFSHAVNNTLATIWADWKYGGALSASSSNTTNLIRV